MMAPTEYLEWERHQELRCEYVDGKVFTSTGRTKAHNRIAGNLYKALDHQLNGCNYEVYIADVKVQFSAVGPYHYPDIVVTSDHRDQRSPQFVSYPCLVVEVLSPYTEAYDRGNKFALYRRLETLKEYVLIQSEQVGVECFRRNSEGIWLYQPYDAGDTIHFESVNFSFDISLLYQRVRFDLPTIP
jgi:Uma2 family endonuclease